MLLADPVPQLASVTKQLAALDLGSNSFHLLVALETNERLQFIDKHKEMVRLAAGLDGKHALSEEVMERALDCLHRFAGRLRSLEIDNVRVVGTNTLRRAKNAKSFIAKAEQVLGHRIEIISGREEARLIYLGVCHDLGLVDNRRLIVDIGGGSTELILGRRSTAEKLESLYMGCVSMSERHFAGGKITKQGMQKAINDALIELEPLAQAFQEAGWDAAIGASGTINAIHDVLRHGEETAAIDRDGLHQIKKQLIEAGEVNKIALDGLSEERRPVFPGGVAILIAIFEALELDAMATAGSALREGLIYDLLGRQHEDDTRAQTVRNVMQRYGVNETHARRVRETALRLLSQVAMRWGLTDSEHHNALSWAAELHEVGMDISHSGFHKHGEYLLANMDMPGFSRSEQSLIASLVRAHRRKLYAEWFDAENSSRKRLTILLRIAALLHRSRSHDALPHVDIEADDHDLTLSLPQDWLAEHSLARLDLEQEQRYLEGIGVAMNLKTH